MTYSAAPMAAPALFSKSSKASAPGPWNGELIEDWGLRVQVFRV